MVDISEEVGQPIGRKYTVSIIKFTFERRTPTILETKKGVRMSQRFRDTSVMYSERSNQHSQHR